MNRLRFNAASPIARYRSMWRDQRRHARRRGIEFQLTFEQWLLIWETSGRLPERGKETGQYVMARPGDQGPYAVGNVRIITVNQNAGESKGMTGQIQSLATCGKISFAHRARSSLTEAQVSEIRRRYVPRSPDANTVVLAREYGVAQATIWFIIANRSWKPLGAYRHEQRQPTF
jgi:hypothetical protein